MHVVTRKKSVADNSQKWMTELALKTTQIHGTNYEPDSLRTMLGALDRYFRNAAWLQLLNNQGQGIHRV